MTLIDINSNVLIKIAIYSWLQSNTKQKCISWLRLLNFYLLFLKQFQMTLLLSCCIIVKSKSLYTHCQKKKFYKKRKEKSYNVRKCFLFITISHFLTKRHLKKILCTRSCKNFMRKIISNSVSQTLHFTIFSHFLWKLRKVADKFVQT
jgi:hypothetical protein